MIRFLSYSVFADKTGAAKILFKYLSGSEVCIRAARLDA